MSGIKLEEKIHILLNKNNNKKRKKKKEKLSALRLEGLPIKFK
jgi:hypothetical protein